MCASGVITLQSRSHDLTQCELQGTLHAVFVAQVSVGCSRYIFMLLKHYSMFPGALLGGQGSLNPTEGHGPESR